MIRKYLIVLFATLLLFVAGCSKSNDTSDKTKTEETETTTTEIPEGLKEAKNPKYKVGTEVILNTDHVEGMKGAKATVVGAYDTTAYTVTYTPLNDGDEVTEHKWIIQEEIENAADKVYEVGEEVVVNAEHLVGMKGTTATVNSKEETTVYLVDYTPTTGGDLVKNYMWVTEDEIKAE